MYEAKIKKKISYSIETIEKIVKSRRLFYINLTLSNAVVQRSDDWTNPTR